MDSPIPAPAFPVAGTYVFRITPRPKTSYFNAIKASEILDTGSERSVSLQITEESPGSPAGPTIAFCLEYPLALGRILESMTLSISGDGLFPVGMKRAVFNREGAQVRHEVVDFRDRTIPLPPTTYPEVLLPFLLGWVPFDGKTRAVFAWITDRFLARVRYRSTGTRTLVLSAGKVEAIEVIMYPDFNDWVRLGNIISRLVGPFIPKYRMWYQSDPPHKLLRFEGSYGPPGAPEIILEHLSLP